MELYLAWGAETLGEIGAGEDEEGDGGDEEAAEEGEVANGVEFLGSGGGDGAGDAWTGVRSAWRAVPTREGWRGRGRCG